MAKKTENSNEDKSKQSTAKEKLILYKAVQEHSIENWIITGALSRAGLLEQYNYEKENLEYTNEIKPSITMDELDKIIKNFLGE